MSSPKSIKLRSNNINNQDFRIPKFYKGTCPLKNSYNIHIVYVVAVPCDCDIDVNHMRNLAYGIEYSPHTKKKKKKKKLKEKEAHYGASVF